MTPMKKESLAQEEPAKEEEQKVKKQNPENSYKEKKESLKAVLDTTKNQRAFEKTSNHDVATA